LDRKYASLGRSPLIFVDRVSAKLNLQHWVYTDQ
jgi:hypothetical protein